MACVTRFLFAAFFIWIAPAVAMAQHDKTPAPHAQDMLPQLCLQLCATAVNLCAPGGAMDDPACVTRRVECPSTCKPCLSGREECGTDSAKFNACLSDYGACIRTKTAERAQSRPQVAFTGGDGATKANAVVISGARDEAEGALAETVWAAIKHPDWKKRDQKRAPADGRVFETVDYDLPKGPTHAWFDVSAFSDTGDAARQPAAK